jgi:1-acyl-sn-glycerol-3-phosphate acyltransferase
MGAGQAGVSDREYPLSLHPEQDDGAAPERPRLIDWLFTFPFLLAFGGLLLLFDPLQRIARLFGRRPQEFTAGALQVTLVWAFRLCGTRIEVERAPGVRTDTAYLVIANHQSLFDIPIACSLLFSNYLKYVSKRELAHWIPSISYNLRRGGNAVIDRDDREQATGAIRELGVQVQQRGTSVLIYPEGTRARRGELGRFHSKGVLTLLEAAPELPLVPFVIDESWRLLRFNLLPVPFGTRIRVCIGAPIERRPGEDHKALLGEVRKEMERVLARWRAANQPS